MERSATMGSETIIDSRLFVRLDIDAAPAQNEAFQLDLRNLGNLAEQLLLYEAIVIPTTDFGIVPTLVRWMGERVLREALSTDTLRFAHRRGFLGYVGNGNAVSTFRMEPRSGHSFEWWQQALFEDADVAIDQQLRSRCPEIVGEIAKA